MCLVGFCVLNCLLLCLLSWLLGCWSAGWLDQRTDPLIFSTFSNNASLSIFRHFSATGQVFSRGDSVNSTECQARSKTVSMGLIGGLKLTPGNKEMKRLKFKVFAEGEKALVTVTQCFLFQRDQGLI